MTLFRQRSHCTLFAVLVIAAPAAPALAGDGAAEPETALPDGRIIYARDVHHSIGAPHFPGQTHTAVTAPTGTIIGTIALALAPLSDSETARVTASVPTALPLGAIADLRAAAPEHGSAQTTALLGAESGSLSIGTSIGKAMGALEGALGSLSVIGGGRP